MAGAKKVPVKTQAKAEEKASKPAPSTAVQASRPFEGLRREVDRVFEDFDRDFWLSPFRRSTFDVEPFWRRELGGSTTPAVDIVEGEKAYEITAELPGMDEKNIEVKMSEGMLTIKGEKQEEREEKEKGYHLHERRFGSFRRSFHLPEGVDSGKVEARFKKGVLTVTVPKKPEAQKPEKTIAVKSA
jgi:HSP20 family protein